MRREGNQTRRSGRRYFEALESRTLLSACGTTGVTEHPFSYIESSSASPSANYVNYSGYTPGQIRKAYGFDQIAFTVPSASGNSTAPKTVIPGDGRGQTIAIVDAFNHPYIKNDLASFDFHFGLNAPPSFQVVNQYGGSNLPATDSGWASEISLDVEWAHAIAPQANLLLVEASSDNLGDLLKGVDYARHAAGVSVVSMSWGGSEFEGETAYDSSFTTPKGHPGVTFINAAGDWGNSGAQWPAASPNVVSVGGTNLHLQDSSGTYGRESGWGDTSGGASLYEARPAFQAKLPAADTTPPPYGSYWGARSGPVRSTPDVAFNADPNTGFAVYDSLSYQGIRGWQVVGGTSAGAPQWAGLIAIANEGRALHGAASLDGPTAALPALYGTYASPNTIQYSSYVSILHDVSGAGSYYDLAAPGYDQVTGLGTPRAAQVVFSLGAQPTLPAATTSTTAKGTASPAGLSGQQKLSSRPRLRRAGFFLLRGGSGAPGFDVAFIDPDRPGGAPAGPAWDPSQAGAGATPPAPTATAGAPPAGLPGSARPDSVTSASSTSGAVPPAAPPRPPTPRDSGAVAATAASASASGHPAPAAANTTAPAAPTAAPAASAAAPVRVVPAVTPAALPTPVALYDSTTDGGDDAAEAAASARGPAQGVSAVAGVMAAGGLAPGAPGTALNSALSAAFGVLSDPAFWGQFSSLLPAAPAADPAVVVRPPLDVPPTVLGLAPALWAKKLQDSRVWEFTAAVCFGVMLAGYWYTTAAAREAEEQQEPARRLRRVREGWEFSPVEAD